MKESDVELVVREYLQREYLDKNNGWTYPKNQIELKKQSEHGADITLYNQKKGDRYVIEVKKWSNSIAANHNAFYSLFGQLLSRIKTVPSEIYSKRRKIVIAVPTQFTKLIHKKIHSVKNNQVNGMPGGWTLFSKALNLRIWSVNMRTKSVTEYHWKDFLKEDLL
jgi:hypothetical protein